MYSYIILRFTIGSRSTQLTACWLSSIRRAILQPQYAIPDILKTSINYKRKDYQEKEEGTVLPSFQNRLASGSTPLTDGVRY